MHVDRARFLALATSMMACHGEHLAPDAVTVATPGEIGRAPTVDTVLAEENPLPEPPPPRTATTPESLRRRCRALRGPSSVCESLDDTRQLCEGLPDAIEPDTAEATVRCLEALAGTDRLCHYEAAPRCFSEASRGSLVNPATKSSCRRAVDRCAGARWAANDLSLDRCTHAASAVQSGRRDRLLSCVAESCGVGRCLHEVVR